jgi:hypothetical protein
MPDIAKEVYRQFKLDHIGQFSPHFAITEGAIAAFFNIKKQIFLFRNEKSRYLNPLLEDMSFYEA